MDSATILVIEGKYADLPVFTPALRKKGFTVEFVASGVAALSWLDADFEPDVIVVNAATLRSTGKRICRSLRMNTNKTPIVLILAPESQLDKVDADIVLKLPFTPQKLVNRIRHLLPSDGKNSLNVGPIRLDIGNRTVRCMGKKTRLTPRLFCLLMILIDRRGEVIERKELFSKAWETDYTGDTRTLDVHISWLRQAIEADPKHPRLLKTIRGVGYCLDV
ncbi:MAG: response regulator transcription factor [Chloroflexota bacterium]